MANTVTTQTIIDGPRNTVVKWTGLLDTSNEAYVVKLNPASYTTSYPRPTTWAIKFLEFAISDGLELQLFWDATTPIIVMPFAGRGNKHFHNFGGLQNNARGTTGYTGSLGLSATQLPGYTYTSGQPFVYTVVLDLIKQFT